MSNQIIPKEHINAKHWVLSDDKKNKDSKLAYALGFVKSVNDEISDISYRFFRIGFYLVEAQNNKYYEELGFNNISDCAEYYFGFKKTTTYDLMNVYRSFRDVKGTWFLPERWKKYSQSQLSVMASVDYYPIPFRDMISEHDTVSDIKKAKSYWNLIKQGKLTSKVMRDRNVGRVYNNVKEFLAACEEILGSTDKKNIVVSSDEFVEDENFSERSENSLPDVVVEKNSGCPENDILYIDDDDPFFDKIKECFSDFLIDNCVFPSRDQFLHEFTCDFLVVLRNFINANMSDFIKYLKSDSFVEEYKNFHPELIFRDKE